MANERWTFSKKKNGFDNLSTGSVPFTLKTVVFENDASMNNRATVILKGQVHGSAHAR